MGDKNLDPEKVATELAEFHRRMAIVEADALSVKVDIFTLAERIAAIEKKKKKNA